MNNLAEFLRHYPRLMVLTGAGISAPSGIPTYRDDAGVWQRGSPIQHQDFLHHHQVRQRYWARSLVGWRHLEGARPNRAHHALAGMERAGYIDLLVTQNVDRLHQRAGHNRVVDLHGRIDRVVCLDCRGSSPRSELQEILRALNPGLDGRIAEVRPDGDAELSDRLASDFVVPSCPDCNGTLMPDVVFYGGGVPRERVAKITAALAEVDGLLVVGSSLMVFSAFRFCRMARQLGKALAILNRGTTRADELTMLKISDDCEAQLSSLCERLEITIR